MKMKPAPKTACCLIKKKEHIVHCCTNMFLMLEVTATTEHRVIRSADRQPFAKGGSS